MENLVNTLEVIVLTRFSSILVRMFVFMKSDTLSNLGHVGSKTNGKRCEHSRGHSFDPILINLGQNVCLYESDTLSKLGYLGSKTRSRGQMKGKACEHSRGHSFDPILINLGQNV